MKRGSIYWINLEPSEPPKMGKVRPCLIISNSDQNMLLPSVVVVPLSSKPPKIWPLRVKIKVPKHKESFAVIPGIRQVSKSRLRELIGMAADDSVEMLGEALSLYLSEGV